MPKDQELETLLAKFADELSAVVERRAANRIGALLAPVLQGHAAGSYEGPTAGPGAGNSFRRTTSPQLCPVPGCSAVAAPRYGMVCTQHKDLPKGEIKNYREARKAEKKAAKRSARTSGSPGVLIATPGAPPAAPKRGRRPVVPVR